MSKNFQVREVTDSGEKQRISREILEGLPQWFGVVESREDYIRNSPKLFMLACYDGEQAVGYIQFERHYPESAEVTVMGVREAYQRQGVGRLLMEEGLRHCKSIGVEYVQVKTLADTHPDENYGRTRKYYRAMGFVPLQCFPEYWDKENPCLVMVRHLTCDN